MTSHPSLSIQSITALRLKALRFVGQLKGLQPLIEKIEAGRADDEWIFARLRAHNNIDERAPARLVAALRSVADQQLVHLHVGARSVHVVINGLGGPAPEREQAIWDQIVATVTAT